MDNGEQGIWVWVGKKASPKERVEAMRNAHGFVKKKGYPSHTAVTRVIDGGEPVDFKQLFTSWRNRDQTTPAAMLNQNNRQNSSRPIMQILFKYFIFKNSFVEFLTNFFLNCRQQDCSINFHRLRCDYLARATTNGCRDPAGG